MVLSQKTEGFLVNLVYSNEVKTSLINKLRRFEHSC